MAKPILLSVDLNHESSWDKALPQAISLARAGDSELHVLTVIPDFGMSMVGSYFPEGFSENAAAETQAALEKFVQDNVPSDIDATPHVLHGAIYKGILATADAVGCGLIVLASHRPEMSDYLLGPNASRVVRHASQSVFVVRG